MKIHLDIFEGPLDLLLYLIKRDHLKIEDISLITVVDQYLQFVELMQLLDIDVASEYMVVAATLISIKSKSLLPKPVEEVLLEEDSKEELLRKLIEYEKFKEAAEFLKNKERERNRYMTRTAGDLPESENYIEASIFDLINAFKAALKDVPKDIFFQVVKDEYTVEEKVHDILHLLLTKETVALNELFTQARSKMEIVVTFLAILELIKLNEIVAVQKELFGEISVIRRQNLVFSNKVNAL